MGRGTGIAHLRVLDAGPTRRHRGWIEIDVGQPFHRPKGRPRRRAEEGNMRRLLLSLARIFVILIFNLFGNGEADQSILDQYLQPSQ